MPQDTGTAQLDPNYDYAKLPDGSYAKFKKGTSPDDMRSQLTAKGLLGPRAKPAYQMSPYKQQAMAKLATQGGPVGEVSKGSHTARYPGGERGVAQKYGLTPSNVLDNIGNVARQTPGFLLNAVTHPQKTLVQPQKDEAQKSVDLWKQKRYSESIGHGLASQVPLIGPFAASLGEQAGSGDIGGAGGQLLGAEAMGKLGGAVVDKTTGMLDSDALRQRAAKLDNKVLQVARSGAKDYGLNNALQVAKEGIISTVKRLPDKIEAKRVAKFNEVKAAAARLDQAGKTLDISQGIGPIVRDVMDVANTQGKLTPQLRNQVMALVKRVTMDTDPATGNLTPRNLQNIPVSKAIELQKGLEDLSEYGKEAPDAVNNLARRLRGAIGDEIGKASPLIQKLRMEESRLIVARKAARENYAKMLNDGRTMARGFIYSNWPALAAYAGLKMVGLSFGPAIAGIIALRTIAESSVSRTARAAAYAKAADLLDRSIGRGAGPTGALGGGTPQPGGIPPNRPMGLPPGQPIANKGVIPQMGPRPPVAPPTAPASVVQPPLLPAWGGPGADTLASGTPMARGGGIAGAGADTRPYDPSAELGGTPRIPTEKDVALIKKESTEDVAAQKKRAAALHEPERVDAQELYRRMTYTMADFLKEPTAANRIKAEEAGKAYSKARGKALGYDQKAPLVEEKKTNVATSNTKIETGASGVTDPKMKAMLDRLDTLSERQASPKSGADRNAIEREIADIKRIISGEATGSEAKAISKRIADRERLSGKRAEAKAATAGASSSDTIGTTAEPAAQSVPPDQRMMLLQQGYAKLASYPDGQTMVNALKKTAADMAKANHSDYDEVMALVEAINFMKEMRGE